MGGGSRIVDTDVCSPEEKAKISINLMPMTRAISLRSFRSLRFIDLFWPHRCGHEISGSWFRRGVVTDRQTIH